MYIILTAILGLAGGGYYFLKPVRDVASTTHQVIGSVRDQASGIVRILRIVDVSPKALIVDGRFQGGGAASLAGIAQSMLPPGAMAMYTTLANQEGGLNGFLSSLKDKDLQGVMDEVKKLGGEDVKRIVEKVEKKVKEANGKVQNVDWQSLAKELKGELPKDKQHYVDVRFPIQVDGSWSTE